jgi:hypothetical protein
VGAVGDGVGACVGAADAGVGCHSQEKHFAGHIVRTEGSSQLRTWHCGGSVTPLHRGLNTVGADDVGANVGVAVGPLVGVAVGASVGDVVGVADGDVVGAREGDAVGDADGKRVGEAVGATEGAAVGEWVGASVGSAVG